MEPRRIMTIRLSKRWTRPELDAIRPLAQYLYSFYSFLGLADPTADLAWQINTEPETGIPHLIVMEIPQDPDQKTGPGLPPEEEIPVPIESSEPEEWGENDLAPDLRN
uniref:Uncharacterized protein n=1 Tax=candidate division WWE3 bacterium TaxID=2053526 RepID=A0A832DUF5_UNCKA